jgi:hypothetical protein
MISEHSTPLARLLDPISQPKSMEGDCMEVTTRSSNRIQFDSLPLKTFRKESRTAMSKRLPIMITHIRLTARSLWRDFEKMKIKS